MRIVISEQVHHMIISVGTDMPHSEAQPASHSGGTRQEPAPRVVPTEHLFHPRAPACMPPARRTHRAGPQPTLTLSTVLKKGHMPSHGVQELAPEL